MSAFDSIGAKIGTLLLITTSLERLLPSQFWRAIHRFLRKAADVFVKPCIEITFDEFPPEQHGRSKAYTAIQAYLGVNFSTHAGRLKGNNKTEERSGSGVALSVDDYEEIVEIYRGIKVSWMRFTSYPQNNVISVESSSKNEKRAYVLSFPRKDRDLVVGSYLTHVLAEGKAIIKRGRKQRLYTNVTGDEWADADKMMWTSVRFEHPAMFETLALDPKRKKEIMDDLIEFTKAKDYYLRIGKPWKRGYLLYGPPGTGKSTMIAAIANFLHYDVYDLELTAVKDNTSLRQLLIEISKRAIVVIEDIDCSLQITGKRKGKKNDGMDDNNSDFVEEFLKKATDSDDDKEESKVTLSGLLNFMDGLWSASGGERIFVFTTNHIERIDEALVRRGRMDKHIHMSYCCFEAFKVLAKNYLNLDSHDKFDKIRCLLSETEISTADVAESLMPKSTEMGADECLDNLITALMQKGKEEEVEENGDDDKIGERGDVAGAERRRYKVLGRLKARIRRLLSVN